MKPSLFRECLILTVLSGRAFARPRHPNILSQKSSVGACNGASRCRLLLRILFLILLIAGLERFFAQLRQIDAQLAKRARSGVLARAQQSQQQMPGSYKVMSQALGLIGG